MPRQRVSAPRRSFVQIIAGLTALAVPDIKLLCSFCFFARFSESVNHLCHHKRRPTDLAPAVKGPVHVIPVLMTCCQLILLSLPQ